MAKRCQAFDLRYRLMCEHLQRRLGIDLQLGSNGLGTDPLLGDAVERCAERVDPLGLHPQSGGSLVPTVCDEILRTLSQRRVQIEPFATLRAEPVPGFTPRGSPAIITTGRLYFSANRPATMPITPGCHSWSASTSAAYSSRS